MAYGYLDRLTTPSVAAAQEANGSRRMWEQFDGERPGERFTEAEAAFIAARDSFYMASVGETGWPYLQHRGGPAGFVQVLDETTLGLLDFRGNRQYISIGNAAADGRVSLFFMDYVHRARLKMLAHLEILALDADPALTERLALPGYKAKPERVFRLKLEAFDWNCQQHITQRFTVDEVGILAAPLRQRLAALEAENAELRARLPTA
jgi:predicted pyridoxine 5'-phosphate oxidase superfamily flavin-nucleotide-binding protein